MKPQTDDPYGPIIAQMKAQNQQAIEKLLKKARTERKKAADKRAAAEAELAQTKQNAEKLIADLSKQHHDKLEKALRKKVSGDLALELLYLKNSVPEVAFMLDLPESFVLGIAESVGIVRHEETTAKAEMSPATLMWLEEESQGRGGNIIFHWNNITCKFWWEFGIGDALIFVEVPNAENWESATGIPLERREMALNFIGQKLTAEHGLGAGKYRLDATAVVVLR